LTIPVGHVCYVTQVYGTAALSGHHDAAGLTRSRYRRTNIDAVHLAGGRQFPCLQPGVGTAQRHRYLTGGHTTGHHARGVERHPYLARFAAHHEGVRHLRHRAHFVLQVQRYVAECVGIVGGAVEGECHYRHVVYGVCLYERRKRAVRRLVHGTGQAGLHARYAPLLVLAHLEANGDHGVAVARAGVDVVHAGQLQHPLLYGTGKEVLGLTRTHPRHGDHHIDHRDRYLRLLLTRRTHQPDCAHREGREGYERGEPGAEEGLRYSSGDSHGQTISPVAAAARPA